MITLFLGVAVESGALVTPMATVSSSTSVDIPPIPKVEDPNGFIQLAHEFVYSASGFYTPLNESMLADDFVFRGPVVGPLNRKDYCNTMRTFDLPTALPDFRPNAFGYHIDPLDPNRVWFMIRHTGTFTGEPGIGLGFGQYVKPTGVKIEGAPETFSIIFDANSRKVKHLSVGYVADRFSGNTNGYGAAFGILKAIGVPLPTSKQPLRFLQWLGAEVLNMEAKTYSKDVPSWWMSPLICADEE
jgi:hypothetical protein